MHKTPIRLAILVSVHNRWESTHSLLSQLARLDHPAIETCIHVTDDSSSDETAVELQKFDVHIVHGDGNFYWAKSMKAAEKSVTDIVDYFLWLNNDVILSEDFFDVAVEHMWNSPGQILVGQTIDEVSGSLSYGGLRRIGKHPHRFRFVGLTSVPIEVDTFCGNIVLIPSHINQELEGIDGNFQHGMADYDFGLRALKRGIRILALPGIMGTCSTNKQFINSRHPIRTIRHLSSIKLLPMKSQFRYCKRHGGLVWPIYFISPYARALLGIGSRGAERKSGAF